VLSDKAGEKWMAMGRLLKVTNFQLSKSTLRTSKDKSSRRAGTFLFFASLLELTKFKNENRDFLKRGPVPFFAFDETKESPGCRAATVPMRSGQTKKLFLSNMLKHRMFTARIYDYLFSFVDMLLQTIHDRVSTCLIMPSPHSISSHVLDPTVLSSFFLFQENPMVFLRTVNYRSYSSYIHTENEQRQQESHGAWAGCTNAMAE
jgi:hypothetical protein